MKKFLVVLAVTIFTMGLISCEPETVEDNPIEKLATDKDDEGSPGDKDPDN